MTAPDAAYYDRWYSEVIQSPARDSLVQQELGLPAYLRSTGLVGWEGLAEVVAALDLRAGGTLLDLACGRGGWGMEVVRRTGVRLVGVDFSAVAIRQAQREVREFALDDRAEFRVADMARTGLPNHSVDAVMCLDSIHFAEDATSALQECRRVMRPGSRVVLTAWQFTHDANAAARKRARHRDLAVDLMAAGFVGVQVSERPGWSAAERGLWQTASTVVAGDDPALTAIRDEACRVLSVFGMRRRVLATATAPA